MASKATEKYTAIYKNSAKKHDAEPVYSREYVAPQQGGAVSVSDSDIGGYSEATQKYIKQFSRQGVASYKPSEQQKNREQARQQAMNNYVRNTMQGRKAYDAVQDVLQKNQEQKIRNLAYLNDPDADKYIEESFKRGNPLGNNLNQNVFTPKSRPAWYKEKVYSENKVMCLNN